MRLRPSSPSKPTMWMRTFMTRFYPQPSLPLTHGDHLNRWHHEDRKHTIERFPEKRNTLHDYLAARRVVITGMGIVSPLGLDLRTFWHLLSQGFKRGIRPHYQFRYVAIGQRLARRRNHRILTRPISSNRKISPTDGPRVAVCGGRGAYGGARRGTGPYGAGSGARGRVLRDLRRQD